MTRWAKFAAASLWALLVLHGMTAWAGSRHGGLGSDADKTGDLVISDVVLRPPLVAGRVAAVFLTITNKGTVPDALLSAHTDVADRVELHRSERRNDGLVVMSVLSEIPLPPGQTVRLRPGGLHVMLFGPAVLEPNERVALRLNFRHAGSRTVDAVVTKLAVSGGHGGHGTDDSHGDPGDHSSH